MKREQLDYPAITAIPEYKAEFDKLARFRQELANAECDDIRLRSGLEQWKQARNKLSEHEVVATAELLLAGKPTRDFLQEIQANQDLRYALGRAIASQEGILRGVFGVCSVKAAARFSEEHKARSRRVVAAMLELHAANLAEVSLRESLEELGFSVRLPAMAFHPMGQPIDPHDKTGGYAPSWFREAASYCQEDEPDGERSALAATNGAHRPAFAAMPVRAASSIGQRSPRAAATARSSARPVAQDGFLVPFEDDE